MCAIYKQLISLADSATHKQGHVAVMDELSEYHTNHEQVRHVAVMDELSEYHTNHEQLGMWQ